MAYLKEPSSTALIRFQHCDPYGHLNNSAYLDYFLNAREDQVAEHYQLPIYQRAHQTGQAWVVAHHQIAYLKPVFLMEKVLIRSRLFAYTDTNLRVEMQMLDEAGKHLKALLWTSYVHVDIKTGKRHIHPEELMSLFKEVVLPQEEEATTFEARMTQLSSTRKAV
jgi:thioesterase-3